MAQVSTQSCTHSLPVAVWRAVCCNCVRPRAAWMRDEWSVSRGLCAGLSTVNPRKGPPGGEVTSSIEDPSRTRNPVTRNPPSSNSATASWGSLGWRVFIQKDVLQLCLKWLGLLLHKHWRERFFRCFRRFSTQPGCLWSFIRRSPKVILELATASLAFSGSPPWAAPAAIISMCGEGVLDGRFSL